MIGVAKGISIGYLYCYFIDRISETTVFNINQYNLGYICCSICRIDIEYISNKSKKKQC